MRSFKSFCLYCKKNYARIAIIVLVVIGIYFLMKKRSEHFTTVIPVDSVNQMNAPVSFSAKSNNSLGYKCTVFGVDYNASTKINTYKQGQNKPVVIPTTNSSVKVTGVSGKYGWLINMVGDKTKDMKVILDLTRSGYSVAISDADNGKSTTTPITVNESNIGTFKCADGDPFVKIVNTATTSTVAVHVPFNKHNGQVFISLKYVAKNKTKTS